MSERGDDRPAASSAGPGQAIGDLDLDLVRARDLAHDLTRSLTRSFDLEPDPDVRCARIGTLDLNRARASALGLDRALDGDLNLLFAHDLAYVRDLVRDLARDLGRARDRARARDIGLDIDLDPDIDRAVRLAGVLESLPERARRLGRVDALDGQQDAGRRVVPSAGRLLAAAARLLPAGDRGRYREEFSSELWDLAQVGGGRCQQFRYTGSQIVRLVQVRAAVLAPRRRGVSP